MGVEFYSKISFGKMFLTVISHRVLRNDFFFRSQVFSHILFGLLYPFSIWSYISLIYLDFYFPFLFGLLFPFSIWTFISLFFLVFYFPFLFGLLFPFLFRFRTFISPFYLDFYFVLVPLFPFSIWTFISF